MLHQDINPEWIMNFITNADEMLDKDPKAQAQLGDLSGSNAESKSY